MNNLLLKTQRPAAANTERSSYGRLLTMRALSDVFQNQQQAQGIIGRNEGIGSTGHLRRRDTLVLHIFGAFTREGYFCALVDTDGSFDCIMAEASGMVLDKVLWICCKRKRAQTSLRSFKCIHNDEARSNSCRNDIQNTWKQIEIRNSLNPSQSERLQTLTSLEQAFKATDILLHSGGLAVIVVDLSSVDGAQLRKVPLTTWFRFARVADKNQTALMFMTRDPIPYSLELKLQMSGSVLWSSNKTDYANNYCAARNIDITEDKGKRRHREFRKMTVIYLSDIRPVKGVQKQAIILSMHTHIATRSKYMFHSASNPARDQAMWDRQQI